jgi:shikimate dehydrogenase
MSEAFLRLGLTGWPLGHSLSPLLHQAALRSCGLNGEYRLYPVPPLPDGQPQLISLVERLRRGELHGLNITIPHKQSALPLVDQLTPTAQAAGAANTLYLQDGQLVGDNTDVPGFLEDLQTHFDLPRSGSALILGAGGAARACVYALACLGWQVFVSARRAEQALDLVADFAHLSPAPVMFDGPLSEAARAVTIDLLVNTTPLGMPSHPEDSPWPKDLSLPPTCRVYDLIYNPAQTPLLFQARSQVLPAANGLGMLVRQAAHAFLLWSGLPSERLPAILQAMQAAV